MTLAAVVAGRTSPKVAIGYVVAQVLGALVAVGLLWAVLMTLIDAATTAQALGRWPTATGRTPLPKPAGPPCF